MATVGNAFTTTNNPPNFLRFFGGLQSQTDLSQKVNVFVQEVFPQNPQKKAECLLLIYPHSTTPIEQQKQCYVLTKGDRNDEILGIALFHEPNSKFDTKFARKNVHGYWFIAQLIVPQKDLSMFVTQVVSFASEAFKIMYQTRLLTLRNRLQYDESSKEVTERKIAEAPYKKYLTLIELPEKSGSITLFKQKGFTISAEAFNSETLLLQKENPMNTVSDNGDTTGVFEAKKAELSFVPKLQQPPSYQPREPSQNVFLLLGSLLFQAVCDGAKTKEVKVFAYPFDRLKANDFIEVRCDHRPSVLCQVVQVTPYASLLELYTKEGVGYFQLPGVSSPIQAVASYMVSHHYEYFQKFIAIEFRLMQ